MKLLICCIMVISLVGAIDVSRRLGFQSRMETTFKVSRRSFAAINSKKTIDESDFFTKNDLGKWVKANILPKAVVDPKKPENYKNAFMIDNVANQERFIIGDAGSTGTRLMFGIGFNKVFVIEGLDAVTTPSGVKNIVKLVLDAYKVFGNKMYVIILATAGARNALSGSAKPDLPSICMEAISGGVERCISSVMPGSLEGYLGWLDRGDTDNAACYIEFGGDSVQFVHSLESGSNVLSTKVKGKDQVFSLSGVKLSFNPIQKQTKESDRAKCSCKGDQMKDPSKRKTCLDEVITPFVFDKDLNECTKKYKSATKKPTCSKYIVKGASIKSVQWAAAVNDDFKCAEKSVCEDTTGFSLEYACANGLEWGKFFSDLGIKEDLKTKAVAPDGSVKIEWYNGMMNLMADLNHNFKALRDVVKNGLTETKSDCIGLTIDANAKF
jgi:hypothetical protein